MRAADAFLDTNVLLYLVSGDAARADAAEALVARGGHVSVQVLNEFASVARRKAGLEWEEIGEVLGAVRQACTVHPLSEQTHDRAREAARRHRFAFYDASIVASALLAGCRVLYSEDFNPGQRIDGQLTVRNPFMK
jgi:predicted nucleic acid-binding protein